MADLPANNAKIHVVKKELLKSMGFCRQNWEFQRIRRERETRTSADKRPRSRITYILEGEDIALYESCAMEAGAPQGNEIRASEDP